MGGLATGLVSHMCLFLAYIPLKVKFGNASGLSMNILKHLDINIICMS